MRGNKKICFVIQRYGKEVNGGAETLCRNLAERMTDRYDVEVITTKAIDYMTWKNEYIYDREKINGVLVRRFPVDRTRHRKVFNVINRIFKEGFLPRSMEDTWLIEQGPVSKNLISYIRKHKDDYDAFVFMTYLYHPIVKGVQIVPEKSVVLPLAHDEPFLRMKIFDPVFMTPKAFLFETEEERNLVWNKYNSKSLMALSITIQKPEA